MEHDSPTTEFETVALQGAESVPEDVVDALSDPYSRYVLRYLHRNPTATLEELVDAVFGAEVTDTDSIATPANREPVRFSLRNTVLPKLDELDYVDFDPHERTVTRADVPREAFSVMGIDG